MDGPHHMAPILQYSVDASLLALVERKFDLLLRTLCRGLFRVSLLELVLNSIDGFAIEVESSLHDRGGYMHFERSAKKFTLNKSVSTPF